MLELVKHVVVVSGRRTASIYFHGAPAPVPTPVSAPWACHLALSQQREAYAKQFPVVTICLFLLFARSPGHPVDEIHVHGRFLAEEGDLMVDVDVYVVPALVSKRYSA